MNILLTNDDGYKASGITELYKALNEEHKVFLIAPKDNCSGMSAAISLRKEIKVEEISENIFSVSGTPADCSYLGLLTVVQDPIDMIVSGINFILLISNYYCWLCCLHQHQIQIRILLLPFRVCYLFLYHLRYRIHNHYRVRMHRELV